LGGEKEGTTTVTKFLEDFGASEFPTEVLCRCMGVLAVLPGVCVCVGRCVCMLSGVCVCWQVCVCVLAGVCVCVLVADGGGAS
ncbi:unnamed protein product, partial [Closterium sp. NIES-53]